MGVTVKVAKLECNSMRVSCRSCRGSSTGGGGLGSESQCESCADAIGEQSLRRSGEGSCPQAWGLLCPESVNL